MMTRVPSVRLVLLLSTLAVIGLLSGAAHAQEGGEVEPFDNPALPGWERTSNAVVAGGVLRIQGEGYAIRPEAQVSGGIVLRLRLEGDGFLEVRYHISEGGMDILRVGAEEAALVRDVGGQQVTLASAPSSLAVGEWWLLELNLAGTEQHAFLGPGVELHAVEVDPLPGAGLMLHVFGEAVAEFDDLTLLPGEGVAPPEAPSAPVPTAEPQPAGDLTWVRTGGPPGGLGYDIRYNFEDPNTWYVTDAYSGVHISTDNGRTWQAANEGIPPQAGTTGDAVPVFSLTVDPLDPSIVWAGTQGTGHIYRSSDGGRTWEQRDSGIRVEHDGLTFRGFTIDPLSSDIVYAMGELTSEALGGPAIWGNGTGGVIFRTADAGRSWEKIWDGGIPSSLTRYMWIDPSNSQKLYVSTGIFDRGAAGEGDPATDPLGGLGVLVSADGGKSWQVQGESHGLRMLYIGSLTMHPEKPEVLLAAAGHASTGIGAYADYLRSRGETSPAGIYRTENGGENWTQVLTPPADRILEALSSVEFCPGEPDIAYAASEARVYRSQDAGATWRELPSSVTGWGPPHIVTGFPIDIQCDPRDADRLFINNYGGGNFLSEDGGQNWVNSSQGYSGALLRSVAVDPIQAGVVYAAGPSGIWRSEDGGNLWNGLANSSPSAILRLDWNTVVVDPVDPQHLLLAGSPEVFESIDGGQSWHKAPLSNQQGERLEGDGLAGMSPISVFAFAPSNPSVVYAGFAHGGCIIYHEPCPPTGGAVIVSQDGGASWRLESGVLPDPAAVLDLAVDPSRSELVFAATEAGLFRSSDGGSTWRSLGIDPRAGRVSAVAIDPTNGNHVLASIDRVGMWESDDGGETWGSRAAGLEPNPVIHDIVFDPSNPARLYASDNASGAYRSQDGGRTWERINAGLTMRALTGMAITSDGQHLYTASLGGGVFRLDLIGQPPAPASIVQETSAPAPTAFPEAETQAHSTVRGGIGSPGLYVALGGLCGLAFLGGGLVLYWALRRRGR